MHCEIQSYSYTAIQLQGEGWGIYFPKGHLRAGESVNRSSLRRERVIFGKNNTHPGADIR
jgi:hypothetical protein